MEQNDDPVPGLPVGRRKRPVWAWLTIGGGVTLIALLTATAMELALRPMVTPASEGAQASPAAAPPADLDLLATVPPMPSSSDPPAASEPAPEPAPVLRSTEAPPPPLSTGTIPPQSVRVPLRAPPAQRVAPTTSHGRDG